MDPICFQPVPFNPHPSRTVGTPSSNNPWLVPMTTMKAQHVDVFFDAQLSAQQQHPSNLDFLPQDGNFLFSPSDSYASTTSMDSHGTMGTSNGTTTDSMAMGTDSMAIDTNPIMTDDLTGIDRQVLYQQQVLYEPLLGGESQNFDAERITAERFKFHASLASLMQKIATLLLLPTQDRNTNTKIYDSVFQYCQQTSMETEPSATQIIQWLQGDFGDHSELNKSLWSAPCALLFSTFPDDVIPDGVLRQHLSWLDMTVLQRYYYLYCISKIVDQERQMDDPLIEPWCFQFLLVGILHGEPLFRQVAQKILQDIDLKTWCSKDIFCGGLVRNSLIRYWCLREHIYTPREVSEKVVVQVILQTMEQKICTWTGFFEQEENYQEFQKQLVATMPSEAKESYPYLTQLADALKQVSFAGYKMQIGMFQCIRSIHDDMVELQYHGCPRAIWVQQNKISDPYILLCLDQFISSAMMQI
jgi:hypothetical protein